MLNVHKGLATLIVFIAQPTTLYLASLVFSRTGIVSPTTVFILIILGGGALFVILTDTEAFLEGGFVGALYFSLYDLFFIDKTGIDSFIDKYGVYSLYFLGSLLGALICKKILESRVKSI